MEMARARPSHAPTTTGNQAIVLLLISNDPQISHDLMPSLVERGYQVVQATNAPSARTALVERAIDVVVLDLMLPDTDGLVLLDDLKRISSQPIIIISRTRRRSDAVLGLRLGADDFVADLLAPEELDARIRAVLRRTNATSSVPSIPEHLQLGDLSVDTARGRVTVGNVPLQVTPIQHRILVSLLRAPDQLLTKKELLEQVWGYSDMNASRAVDVHLSQLRRKLQQGGPRAPTIISLRIQAYRLTPGE